ncbi:MAG TPA: hypothetical protein VFR12_07060, partial [Pyrinomonadaceae bacterium]|nr:hypothetical protein [Pyrinomonadaceae bacterium]
IWRNYERLKRNRHSSLGGRTELHEGFQLNGLGVNMYQRFETGLSKDQKGIASLFETALSRLWRIQDRCTTVSYPAPLP